MLITLFFREIRITRLERTLYASTRILTNKSGRRRLYNQSPHRGHNAVDVIFIASMQGAGPRRVGFRLLLCIQFHPGIEYIYNMLALASLKCRIFGNCEQSQLKFFQGFSAAVAHLQYLRHVERINLHHWESKTIPLSVRSNKLSAPRNPALVLSPPRRLTTIAK